MQQINDEKLWFEAWLDTPFNTPADRVAEAHRHNNPNLLLDVPGVCLKSHEIDEGKFPKHCGVLVSYSEEKVVVRGHGSPVSPKCVWIGTANEYRRMWEVD